MPGMLQAHTPLQPSLFSLLLLENLNPSSFTASSTSKFSPWWFVKLPQKPSGASAACREQTRVEAGAPEGAAVVEDTGTHCVHGGGTWRRGTAQTSTADIGNLGFGYSHWSGSSTLRFFLPGACKMPNPKVTPHSSFHVCNSVISKESKKKMMKLSPGSTPEQQVWVRGLKSTPSPSSPQFPRDFTAQI